MAGGMEQWAYRYGWAHARSHARMLSPRKALRGSISKSILQRPCRFLAIIASKMAPRMTLECPHEGSSVAHLDGARGGV